MRIQEVLLRAFSQEIKYVLRRFAKLLASDPFVEEISSPPPLDWTQVDRAMLLCPPVAPLEGVPVQPVLVELLGLELVGGETRGRSEDGLSIV